MDGAIPWSELFQKKRFDLALSPWFSPLVARQTGDPNPNPNQPESMKTNAKKLARISATLAADPDVRKFLRKNEHVSPESVADDLARFVSATADGRMVCVIHSVSASGMSRTMSFYEMAKYEIPLRDGRKFGLLNFRALFRALGYTPAGEGFRIGGCGMDMVFATHHEVIHSAARFGVITEERCAELAQMTPSRL